MPYIGKSPVGGGFHKLDSLTASATDTYALTLGSAAYFPETANQLLVSLNGVIQAPQDSFTVSGSNLVFDTALTSSDSIDFVVALGDVLGVGSVTDGAITTAKLGNGAVTDAKIDTMAASKLTNAGSGAFYQTGTWTPVISDATSGGNTASTTTATGSYTKIGRLVTINLNIEDINTSGMGTGNFYIQGLPFTSSSSAGSASGIMLFNGVTLGADETGGVAFQLLENDSYLRPVAMEDDGGNKNVLNSSQLTSGSADISGSITYMTD